MGQRKPFSRRLYNKYDELAKSFGAREFEKIGLIATPNKKKTAVDLVVTNSNGVVVCYAEVEIKKALDKPFDYDTIQLPERKWKYAKLEHPTLFMLFSSDGSKYFCFWDKFVLKAECTEVFNKYVACNEMFFQIPLKNADSDIQKAFRRHWKRN